MPFAIAAGISAGAAIAAGATVTAGAVASIVAGTAMAASLSMMVVGVATGDKSLMKIGSMVGMAGGVVGMAGSAMSAGTAAASGAMSAGEAGATAAGTAASEAGTQAAATTAMAGGNAITPVFQSGVGVLPQASAGAMGEAGSAMLASGAADQALGQTTSNFLGSGLSSTGQAAAAAAPMTGDAIGATVGTATGANVGTNVGTAAANMPQAANQNLSFFDKLTTPEGLVKMGGTALQGISTYYGNRQNNQLARDRFNYEAAQNNWQLNNINTPGANPMAARDPTRAEIAQAQREQAAQAKANARLLTQ